MADNSAPSILHRLNIHTYAADECRAAIRGEKVPFGLGLPLIRLCVTRGIRYHIHYAGDLHGTLPEFTRALNARMIMSNIIPNMVDVADEEIPYCIWHPDIASESTYRQLVQHVPRMRYQVARACAVAGYTELYQELDILPDVHVAEEARECGNIAIFDHIMAAPVRYSVMDDYTRSIDWSNAKPAMLNGDTAARWTLDDKQQFTRADIVDEDSFGLFDEKGFEEHYFNITEDFGIDEKASNMIRNTSDIISGLLSAPLPVNLPTVEKDLLILMAAYYGDIDRYVRLRRPMMINKEVHCCVHGIYHNTMFAVWWSKQQNVVNPAIHEAVKARFIMNNVLAPAILTPNDNFAILPTVISNPTVAYESTYSALAKYKPNMIPQILHACIQGNYTDLFDELIIKVNKTDLEHIQKTVKIEKIHFREAIDRRMEELGCTPRVTEWLTVDPYQDLATSTVTVPREMGMDLVKTTFSSSVKTHFMHGVQCDVSMVELLACLPDDWKLPTDDTDLVELDYKEWPPNWGSGMVGHP